MAKLFANSGDPDQMPCSAASDLGLHCLPITLLGFPDYNWLRGMHTALDSATIFQRETTFCRQEFSPLVL